MAGGSFLATLYALKRADFLERSILITAKAIDERGTDFSKVIGFRRYPGYDKLGEMMAKFPLVLLLYNLPVYLTSLFAILVYRPKVIASNGAYVGFPAMLLSRVVGARFVLFYHTQLEFYVGTGSLNILRTGLRKLVDHAVVNSVGSKTDLQRVFPADRITVVGHWAPPTFFANRDRDEIRNRMGAKESFVVLYAGWLNEEKRCHTLLKLAASCSDEPRIQFWFAGEGKLKHAILERATGNPRIRYLGYVEAEDELAQLYTAADIVWAVADTTYLARAGVEALACGTPIVVPVHPGVAAKANRGYQVPQGLFPASVGWIVDDENVGSLTKLVVELSRNRATQTMRGLCREYAMTSCDIGTPSEIRSALAGI